MAWSENLVDRYPSIDESGDLKNVATPRKNKFDSHFTACDPPAVITKKGVVLFYNGINAENENGARNLAKETYLVGQIIFDPHNLEKVLERSDTPFVKPSLPHETTGLYMARTTFAEGLVFFKGQWFMYYGAADSFVGLAITNNEK